MKRRSQLTAPTVAVDRNINNSSMDIITSVNSHIDEIAAIGTEEVLADIAIVAGLDFDAVLDGVDVIDNLTVAVVETLPAGTPASAELVGSEIRLRIPKGLDGVDGVDGSDGVDGVNGRNGSDGTNGVDGYTPIKGVDYVDGANGHNGVTPIPIFNYNASTGYLTVEINEYANINTGTTVVATTPIDIEVVKDEIIAEMNTSEEW